MKKITKGDDADAESNRGFEEIDSKHFKKASGSQTSKIHDNKGNRNEIEEIQFGDLFIINRLNDYDVEFYECLLSASDAISYFQSSFEEEQEHGFSEDNKNNLKDFFNNSSAIIITYDVTNIKSFDAACSIFYPLVEQLSPEGSLIMLIGTKSDKVRDRVVSIEDVEQFASINNLFFMEVSSFDMTNIQLTLNILNIHSTSNNKTSTIFDDQNEMYEDDYEDEYNQYENDDYAIMDDVRSESNIAIQRQYGNEYSSSAQYEFSPPPPPPPSSSFSSIRNPRTSPNIQNYYPYQQNHTANSKNSLAQMEYAKVEQLFSDHTVSPNNKIGAPSTTAAPPPPPPLPPPFTSAIIEPPLLSEKKKTITHQRLQQLSTSKNQANIQKSSKPEPKESTNSRAQNMPKRSQHLVDDRPVISKVDFVVGKGKTLTILIREGDSDPSVVVEKFKKTNGFRSQRIADLVLQEVTRAFAKMEMENKQTQVKIAPIPILNDAKLDTESSLSNISFSKVSQMHNLRRPKRDELSNVTNEGSRLTKAQQMLLFKTMGLGNAPQLQSSLNKERNSFISTPPPTVTSKVNEIKPLFNVEINMNDGKVEQLLYYEGDEFDEVAKRFCEKHSLPDSKATKLSLLLKQTYQNHHQIHE